MVAVGKQHGEGGFVGTDFGGEHAHHVGAVGVEGDAAEAFGFALRIKVAAAGIQAVEGFVGGGIDFGFHGQHKRLGGHIVQRERFAVFIQRVAAFGQRFAV